MERSESAAPQRSDEPRSQVRVRVAALLGFHVWVPPSWNQLSQTFTSPGSNQQKTLQVWLEDFPKLNTLERKVPECVYSPLSIPGTVGDGLRRTGVLPRVIYVSVLQPLKRRCWTLRLKAAPAWRSASGRLPPSFSSPSSPTVSSSPSSSSFFTCALALA